LCIIPFEECQVGCKGSGVRGRWNLEDTDSVVGFLDMMGLHYSGHALFSGLRRSCTAVVACTGFFELSATVAGRILQDTGINSGQCNKANNVNEQESLKENLPSEIDSQV